MDPQVHRRTQQYVYAFEPDRLPLSVLGMAQGTHASDAIASTNELKSVDPWLIAGGFQKST